MKVVLTMQEVVGMVRNGVSAATQMPILAGPNAVRFVHKHADGSGECDVEDMASIDRVEVEIDSV